MGYETFDSMLKDALAQHPTVLGATDQGDVYAKMTCTSKNIDYVIARHDVSSLKNLKETAINMARITYDNTFYDELNRAGRAGTPMTKCK